MKLEFVGPYFMIVIQRKRATIPKTCETCQHGLVGTMYLSNSRDYVWCGIGYKKKPKHTKACTEFKEIWKKL